MFAKDEKTQVQQAEIANAAPLSSDRMNQIQPSDRTDSLNERVDSDQNNPDSGSRPRFDKNRRSKDIDSDLNYSMTFKSKNGKSIKPPSHGQSIKNDDYSEVDFDLTKT